MQLKYLVLGLCVGGIALTLQAGEPASQTATVGLFDRDDPLALDVYMDTKALCRDPRRQRCDDLPAELVYRDDYGAERRIGMRCRRRYHSATATAAMSPP